MMRSARVTCLFTAALVLTAAVAGCGGFERRQGIADAGDPVIVRDIREKFDAEPKVDLDEVDIVALDGTVRLTGRVNSQRERQRAGEIAAAARGVHDVDNEIAIWALVAPKLESRP